MAPSRCLAPRTVFWLAALLLAASLASGAPPRPDKAEAAGNATPAHEARLKTTDHAISLEGRRLAYEATAGDLVLKGEDGKAQASIFFVAYTLKGEGSAAQRPITFCFNGGPGSSSVWLHLGAFGPKRLAPEDLGHPSPPPYRLIDNPNTILDQTDLVFIDPVDTGYSRVAPGVDRSQYHSIDGDIESVADFIRLYVTRFGRWDSPKFIIGESYGALRAVGVAARLMDHTAMYVNGLILISPALNFQTFSFDSGNDLPYLLFLPTYSAAAWYHKRLGKEVPSTLPALLKDAEAFAFSEYATDLLKGDSLDPNERKQLEGRLSALTGLSQKDIVLNDLRVPIGRFAKSLLRNDEMVIGRFDSRITGHATDPAAEGMGYDPSYDLVFGPFGTALNAYLRNELGVEKDIPYEILSVARVNPWDYSPYKNRYTDFTDILQQLMTEKPFLRVYVASGVFDLAIPYAATRYAVDHLGLPPELQKHVTLDVYEAGHMMYTNPASLAKLKKALTQFLDGAQQPQDNP